ncbi:hypothetical protein PBS_60670 [Paraburkholderia sp. 2C]
MPRAALSASFAAAFSGIPATAVYLRADYHRANGGLGLVLGMLGLGIASRSVSACFACRSLRSSRLRLSFCMTSLTRI